MTSGQLFGTKEQMNGNYLYRMAGAVLGIYGNSETEAMYPVLSVDADGKPLSGENNDTLTFPAGGLPPVNAVSRTHPRRVCIGCPQTELIRQRRRTGRLYGLQREVESKRVVKIG